MLSRVCLFVAVVLAISVAYSEAYSLKPSKLQCTEDTLNKMQVLVCPKSDPRYACLCPTHRHLEREEAIRSSVRFACCNAGYCDPEFINLMICCPCNQRVFNIFS